MRSAPAGRHHVPETLIERASRILLRPMSADDRQAVSEAKIVLAAHRRSLEIAAHCRACGEAMDCTARESAKARIAAVRQRATARRRQ